jgi:hypothetical protein
MKYMKNTIMSLGFVCVASAAMAAGSPGMAVLKFSFVVPSSQENQQITIERTALGDGGAVSKITTVYQTSSQAYQPGFYCGSAQIFGATSTYHCTLQTFLPTATAKESYKVSIQPMASALATTTPPVVCHRAIVQDGSTAQFTIHEIGQSPVCTTEV